MRRFGLACDNLLSVDIVTADGQLRKASATEHPDLFWGLRGGGGNFGIVTSFAYRLHPVGPTVLGGLLIHPMSAAKEVFQFYREFTPTAPEELTIYLGFATSPEGDPVVAAIVCYSGSLEQGEDVIAPLRKFGTPMADLVGPMPYTALQDLSREMFPPRRFNYWKSSFVYDLSDQAIDTMIAQFAGVPSPFTQAAIEQLGGAVSRIGKDETAFSERSAPYNLIIASVWTDPAENDKNIRWTREFWEVMRPYESEAVYVNYLDIDEQDRIRAAYGEKYDRLVALKNQYDPTNFFQLNQNIKPAT
jgi:hypothetical protein